MTMPPNTPNYQSMPPQQGGGLSTAAFVVGIVALCCSIVLFCIPFLGGLLGVLAIVLGAIAMSQSPGGKGKTGLILGVIAVIISIGIFIAARAGLSFLQKKGQSLSQTLQQEAEKAQKQAEEMQKKQEEEMRKRNQSTEPSTGPSGAAPCVLPWRLASSAGQLPPRVMFVELLSRA